MWLLVLSAATLWEDRARKVCVWAQASWHAYFEHAAPADSLSAVRRAGKNDFGGLRVTAIDAMDTLWTCKLDAEYEQARTLALGVRRSDEFVNVFETTIRTVGGLVSMFHLTKDPAFRDTAHDLGAALLPAFGDDGFVAPDVRMTTGDVKLAPWGWSSLSEATLVPEFRALTHITGDTRFAAAADRAFGVLLGRSGNGSRLLPMEWRRGDAVAKGTVTLGARGDSYYEYLFKSCLQAQRGVECAAFAASVELMRDRLFRRVGNFTFVDEIVNDRPSAKMDHLVCFLPGTMAWAVRVGVLDETFLDEAKRIFETCRRMHATPTGLAPEITKCDDAGALYSDPQDRHNLLRPETLESAYLLWATTRDDEYRHISWRVVQAFANHSRTGDAFCSRNNVYSLRGESDCRDEMPSYWLAETLKYAHLSFADTPLRTDAVLNTEAHLLPMVEECVQSEAAGASKTWV